MGGRHDEPLSGSLQLEDVRARDLEMDLLGRRTRRPAKLQRGHAVAVDARVHVRRPGIKAGADDEAHLPVRVGSRAQEFRDSLHQEVALHLLPGELVVVVVGPHVVARRRDEVFLGILVEGDAAGNGDAADVGMPVEDANGGRLVRRPGRANGAHGQSAQKRRN